MPMEHPPEVKFSIRHVLLIDVVGYSKLLIKAQRNHIQKLKQIVRGIEHFFRAAEEKVTTLANQGWRRAPFLH